MRSPGALIAALDRGLGRITLGLGYMTAVSIALFALSIPLDLLMRRVGLGNIPWLYEVIEYALYAGVFLAAPWVLREGAHVRVDILVTSVPRHLAVRLEQGLNVFGACIAVVLAWYGWRAAFEAYVSDSRQFKTLTVHDSLLMGIFTVAALLLALEFLFRIARVRAEMEAATDVTSKAAF